MTLQIRPMRPSDEEQLRCLAAALAELHARELPAVFLAPAEPWWPPASSNSTDRRVFVAESAPERLVGFVDVRIIDITETKLVRARRIGAVKHLIVSQAVRGRGIGRALMDRAKAWLRCEDCAVIELTVFDFNASARALYESLGYATVSRTMELELD